MSVTSESTALDDEWRRRREGTELWGRTKALLDELERFRAEAARLKASNIEKAKIPRESYTNQLHTAIDTGVELHRPQLLKWTGSATGRAKWLQKQIAAEAEKNDTGVVPSWRYVYEYLKTLPI